MKTWESESIEQNMVPFYICNYEYYYNALEYTTLVTAIQIPLPPKIDPTVALMEVHFATIKLLVLNSFFNVYSLEIHTLKLVFIHFWNNFLPYTGKLGWRKTRCDLRWHWRLQESTRTTKRGKYEWVEYEWVWVRWVWVSMSEVSMSEYEYEWVWVWVR